MQKIKVSLRSKEIKRKRESLFLDFYPAIINEKGKSTRREFLKKYIYTKPKDLTEKQHNLETLAVAEKIMQLRQNQFDKPEIYTEFEKERIRIKEQGEKSFIKYFNEIADKRKGSTYDNWVAARHYLQDFVKGDIRFCDVNDAWCNAFKDYLLKVPSRKSSKVKLSPNSAISYLNKLRAVLKQAFKDGILQVDVNRRIESIKYVESHRQFLTEHELSLLFKTQCPLPPVWPKAAMFAALTGLRFSDIKKMLWREVQYNDNDGYLIEYTQKKTTGAERLQISRQAYELLGERKQPDDIVFEGLHYSDYNNELLKKWVRNAGITKKFTFHCLRHTHATLLLTKGVDLFTVSKMLGHKNVNTTLLYAKIVNETKRKAADTMQFDFLQ